MVNETSIPFRKNHSGKKTKGKQMRTKIIKTAIRFQNNMVMVFDEEGEQIPEYQGQYEDVKGIILRDAPPDAIFAHGYSDTGDLIKVSREEW